MNNMIDLNFTVLHSAVLTLNDVTATDGETGLTPMRVCPLCQRYACVDMADLAEHFENQHGENPE